MNIKKSELALTFLIILTSLHGQNNSLDYAIEVSWIIILLCAFKNQKLFYGIIAGVSLFASQLFVPVISLLTINVFAVIISLYFLIRKFNDKSVHINARIFGFYVIVLLYVVLVLGAFIGKTTQIIMVLAIMLLCCELAIKLKDEENLVVFAKYFVLATISASLYGLIGNSSFVDASDRFCGTSTDPNYFGYFLVISFVFLGIIKKHIPNWVYISGKIALAILIVFTGSNTALIALFLMLIVNILMRDISFASKGIYVLVLIIVCGVVYFERANIGKAFLSINSENYFADRYLTTFGNLLIGESNAATSGRTNIVGSYLRSFSEFSFFEKIFGGHVCGIFGVDANYANDLSLHLPHNLNIDVLFSIGIFGLLYVYSIVFSSFRYWFGKRGSEVGKHMILLKLIVVLYTFSLSYFLGFPSMIFLFL
ncbi:MAG: hypothetical protein IKU48_00365 [Clostridia bacterium]|nr:hypothetical protein [Clostridia bacterium]